MSALGGGRRVWGRGKERGSEQRGPSVSEWWWWFTECF